MYADADLITLCRSLTSTRLERWLDEGWIVPHAPSSEKAFNDLDRSRADLICYLVDDLDIQENAVPVILSLLDQVYGLRGELRTLADAISNLPARAQTDFAMSVKTIRKTTS